mmetsp:Transcript_6245/g.15507  ORF Transcript_6245/g.15507 Transcript_6245/m.15507 type:complete len:145 (-) Transcript_6245:182-616(-)|eukprot:CAMPEP_0117467394 /NCGR_PEP_ID=MMETSP0784-20121206/5634_1 /TAXON_ID=39447 /ORGANISM="" /LENGTH=144 /DNA_ID=CAMNT_0005261363 /DNA_START=24 /DNA_END=458 /DNA_ORIENTATION=+
MSAVALGANPSDGSDGEDGPIASAERSAPRPGRRLHCALPGELERVRARLQSDTGDLKTALAPTDDDASDDASGVGERGLVEGDAVGSVSRIGSTTGWAPGSSGDAAPSTADSEVHLRLPRRHGRMTSDQLELVAAKIDPELKI